MATSTTVARRLRRPPACWVDFLRSIDCIDTPRTYRLEQLPRALPWKQVVALLRSIDQTTPGGLRDFTLLYLAACYGLRSGELVRLTLDDIDWRAGTLKVVQTKTKQTLLLPLTDEAGQILVRYLQTGRPHSQRRELFLRRRAPAGTLAPTAVHDILEHRIALSGLALPPIGSHVLRHSLAVDLLRRGECLPTIGATLGHRDVESTAVYLRLAVEDLRDVGLPVPQGASATVLDGQACTLAEAQAASSAQYATQHCSPSPSLWGRP
jgi:integrase/recombinase XerD